MTQVQFLSLADLSTLPWFGLDGTRLVVKDRSIGPVLDMHSHLALAYVRPMQLDLQKFHETTEHYLPSCCPIHLDVYVNDNFRPEDLTRMKKDLTVGSLRRGGMRATHTVPNLMREMEEMNIRHSVVLPIDFPFLSHNTETAVEAVRNRHQLIAFGSVHPYSHRLEEKVKEQARMGVRGLKMHPAVQSVRPDDARAMRLYHVAGEHNLPILWHCGPVGIEPALGRYLSQVAWYEEPIRAHPNTTFVLGHAGARQPHEALRLLNTYPNVWMELSSQGLSTVKMLLEKGDTKRIMYGTDWPFYHQGIALAKVLMATEGDPELRHRILYGNAARLLKIDS